MVPPAICHVSLPSMLIQISACNVLIQLVHDTRREIQQIGVEAFCSTTSTKSGCLDLLNCWYQEKRDKREETQKNYKRGNFQQLEQRHVVLCILIGAYRVSDELSASILMLDSGRWWH
jgi:hypothetical protein